MQVGEAITTFVLLEFCTKLHLIEDPCIEKIHEVEEFNRVGAACNHMSKFYCKLQYRIKYILYYCNFYSIIVKVGGDFQTTH